MSIETQPSGTGMDRLVGTDVMGWEWVDADGYWITSGPHKPAGWSPSTDIEAAMEVVERLRAHWDRGDNTYNFLTIMDCGLSGWRVEIEFFPDHDAPVVEHHVTAETLPHALCLVALEYFKALYVDA
jgi:hypothetical protein